MKAAVFDLDGTLADTPSAISALLITVAAEAGRTVTEQQVRPTIGKPLEPSIGHLIGRPVDDPATVRAVARYRQLFSQEVVSRGPAMLYPGVREGLVTLHERGTLLAVGTSKITSSAEALLSAMGIRDLFGAVIGHDQVSHAKPHPETGLRAAAALGLDPTDCAYIGDTVTDMRMAHAAGMEAVAVSYGVASPEELGALEDTVVCEDFASVVRVLTASSVSLL
ncbi:MAG TPA: HAD family hydrolase [Streptomyces sp.]|nr:HAD family hydrolase [Streptomyces sp.]